MDHGEARPIGDPPSNRSCHSCTLCCRLPDIDSLSKPANVWCPNCVAGFGCAAYAVRPETCRAFSCAWITDPGLGPEWDPLVSRMMVYQQGPQTTVLVDPDHPPLWRQAPYDAQLRTWARMSASRGGYVIVFVGDAVFKVEAED